MRTIRILFLLAAAATAAFAQTSPAALVGNVERGKTAFTTYKCYSCHGTKGETGSPRLVPMGRAQENFIAFVRKPTAQGMPPFADVQEQTLADVYAYIKSIPSTAQPVESIPLLNDILKTLK